MTHEEIIAMAKETGGYESPQYPENLVMDAHDLARFAALVAAREREACALVCDAKAHEVRLWCNESNVIACAAAIRARGTKEGA